MAPPANLKCIVVHLVCRRCRATKTVYLMMDQPVPEPVRCPAARLGGGGGGVAALACDSCHLRFPDLAELRRLVEDEMRGRSRNDHLRNGAVRVEC